MRPLVRSVLALGCLVAAAAGCGRSGPFDDLGGSAPTPRFPGGGTSPTPTPEGLAMPYGDGRDGPFTAGPASVINECAVLVNGTNGSITVESVPSTVAVGTVILAWQVQNDFATVADQSDIDDPQRAGHWDLTRVAAITGNELAVYPPLTRSFSTGSSSRAQVCNVPEYTDVTIEDGMSIAGVPWAVNAVGGIVAFFANGTVTLDGTVNVAAMGFRGGAPSAASVEQDFTDDVSTDSMFAGGKGEGLDGRGLLLYARGNCSNGGGGGNALRAGGGGGGNGGNGGLGGFEMEGEGDDNVSRGLGGPRVTAISNRLLPGGGGGGGHRSLAGSFPRGGHGGGVVLMMANVLTGQGSIIADGEKPPDIVTDGAGGGGAGGMIDLRIENGDAFAGELIAEGGDGANNTQGGGGIKYGPGGGGGGGIVRVFGPIGDVTVDVGGGDRGESGGESHSGSNGSGGSENVP